MNAYPGADMSTTLLSSSSAWFTLCIGALLLIYATTMAVLQREWPRRLILWGALHDLGVCFVGLSGASSIGLAGILLYLLFQVAARCLAWTALNTLDGAVAGDSAHGVFQAGPETAKLAGVGRLVAWPGAMFAMGLLAAIGGSAFLVPEGRAFMVSGVLEAMPTGGFSVMMLMAAATTVFIFLYVDTVRRICLQAPSGDEAPELKRPDISEHKTLVLGLGLLVAVLGLLRHPVAEGIGAIFGLGIPQASPHISYWIYYIGAFVTGAAFFWKAKFAPWLGTLFFAGAFAAVCADPAGPLANLFLFVISLVGLVVAIYSISYIHDDRKGWYWFFLALTFGSLAAIVSVPNVAALFSYWELMTFASYFLVVHEGTAKAFSAGLKYYVMCAGAAIFMLPGLLALGVFSIEPGMALQFPFWLKASLFLCLIGFGAKAGLVPLHAWLPEAHPAAPSSVSAPLSGVITKMGIFGLISVVFLGVGPAEAEVPGLFGLSWFGTWLCLMGAATLIYGEIMALCQTDIKKMLAYSTMGQIGEVALILSIGTWLATAGSLWHIINHAIMKDLLFLAAGALIMRAGSRELSELRGLGRQMPLTVACMCAGLISIMGLPPFGAFYSKFLMIQAAVDGGQVWMAVLLLAGALAGAIYYTRILKTLVFEQRAADAPAVSEAPFEMRIALVILALLTILFGLAPQLLMPLVVPAASLCFQAPENAMQIIQAMSINWPVYVILPVFGAALPAIFVGKPRMAGWTSVGILLLTAALVAILGRNLDTLSYCFALIVPLVGALNMAYAIGYMSHSHSQWRFYCAFTCMCGGLVGMAASQYLLSFFLFWEVMSSWTLYLAIAHEGGHNDLREAFKYFIFNLFGAGFIFVGLAIVGPFTPFNSYLLTGVVSGVTAWGGWLGMALLAIGFLLKAAQLPFRIDWQMHPALAPTPVSGYISSVLLKSAIIALIKLFMLLGGALAISGIVSRFGQSIISVTAMWIGAITIIMAAIQALKANGLKLVFIYSTVSQLGYMVLAVACGTSLAYAGGMLHLINHVFFKDLLFLVCGAVMFATHKDSLYELGGLGRKMPFTFLMFAIAGLSLVGVPPTSGFSSKWIIYQALMQAGQPLLALLSLVGSVITLAYIAKFMHAVFLGQPCADLEEFHEAPKIMRVTMFILAAGCIFTGVYPGLALYPINSILAQYGAQPLDIGLSGILSGPGAWNATGVFVLMAVAFFGAYWFMRRFTHLREIDVHTCGLPVEEATSRIPPTSIYGDIARLLFGRGQAKENR